MNEINILDRLRDIRDTFVYIVSSFGHLEYIDTIGITVSLYCVPCNTCDHIKHQVIYYGKQ